MTQDHPAPSSLDLIGHSIRHHEVIERLSQGRMGDVYVARHETDGTLRTLMVLHDEVGAHSSDAMHFAREAAALAELAHPHLTAMLEHGWLHNGWPFLLREFVRGNDLEQISYRRGPMPLPDAVDILIRVAQVLDFAHGRGVIHRDLKPANVLLADEDARQVKVIDLGLTRLLSAAMINQLTAENQVLGAPQYIAPEQARGAAEITGAVDVYALAGIGYTLLSGKSVFGPRPPLALVYAHWSEAPERLSLRVSIPRRLDDVLYACLAKTPEQRPSASELASELEQVAAEHEASIPISMADVSTTPVDLPDPAEAYADLSVSDEPVSDESATDLSDTDSSDTDTAPSDGVPQLHGYTGRAGHAGRAVTGNEMISVSGAVTRKSQHEEPQLPSSPQVFLSTSMVAEVRVAHAADLIFAPVPHGSASGVHEALQRQMLAVVDELAAILAENATESDIDQELLAVRQNIAEVEAELTAIELDAALLDDALANAGSAHGVKGPEHGSEQADAQGGEVPGTVPSQEMDGAIDAERASQTQGAAAAAEEDEMVAVASARADLAARIGRLRSRRNAAQRTLTVIVQSKRPSAPEHATPLYVELEQMVERVQALNPEL